MTTNFYRKYTYACPECGRNYHPCAKDQKTCSKACAAQRRHRSHQEKSASSFVPLTVGELTAVIHLTKGMRSYVDVGDWADISRFMWFYHSDGSAARGEYVGNRELGRKHKVIRLHQHLLPCPKGLEPDHQDLDRLNNRRSNLRVATSGEQKMNQRLRANNTSGFKGVAWDANRQRWQAYVRANGKRVTIGRFKKKINAIVCRRAVAKFVHGKFYRETA